MSNVIDNNLILPSRFLPPWFKQDLPDMNKIKNMKQIFRRLSLHTVCESAHCPNMGRCWGKGVATFMILGDICTRSCSFCSVDSGNAYYVNKDEPKRIAEAVSRLNLKYVVITSVTRDDLRDKGASHFSLTITEIKQSIPGIKVEVLIPDLSNDYDLLSIVIDAKPDIIGHNLETIERLYQNVRSQSNYKLSLNVLKTLKEINHNIITKSSIMIGLGETNDEVMETMNDIVECGCDIITIGQYLSPGIKERNIPVNRFVTPEEFKQFEDYGYKIGFKYVLSKPLARSSFLAEDGYNKCISNNSAKVIDD